MSGNTAMNGDRLRAIRSALEASPEAFIGRINKCLGRRYSPSKLSRWEKGEECIPPGVSLTVFGMAPVDPPECAVIAIANQKGGVGKTTTAINLGYLMARAGYRTLLLDLDPQANATIHLGVSPITLEEEEATVYQVLLAGRSFADIEVSVLDSGLLRLAGSGPRVAIAESELLSQAGNNFVLSEKLEAVRKEYSFVFLDCPPHLGLLTINALTAADKLVIPTQAETLSTMGIPLLLDTISKVQRRGNPHLEVVGILPTMVGQRLSQDQATLDDLNVAFGDTIPVFDSVPRATIYAQSAAEGRPTLEIDNKAKGAEAYERLAARLAATVINASDENNRTQTA